jgi:Mg-chelatase subunit ChlD
MNCFRLLPSVGVALILSGAIAAQSPQVFRATETIVTVDAAVLDGTRPVLGLTANDFEVTDNGVRQKVDMVDVESLPIDLTLVVDISGSVEGMMDEIRGYMRQSESLLRIDDRIRVITFAGQVREAVGLQPAMARRPSTTPPWPR